jgi:hypothetical protein
VFLTGTGRSARRDTDMIRTIDYSLQSYRDDVRAADRRIELLREVSGRSTAPARRRGLPVVLTRWASRRRELRRPEITFP